MKRFVRIFAVLFLLLLLPATVLAEDISLFKKISLRSKLTLPVYSAPSTSAWRGANGKAEASTNATIYAVGWDGDWLLIMYGTSGGATRVGYTPRSALKGSEPNLPELEFEFRDASISKACTMTDDTKKGLNSIAKLSSGAKVTYLASFTDTSSNGDGVTKAYIETKVDGKTARGFVPMSCVKVNSTSSTSGSCSTCYGRGTIFGLPCYTCGGSGRGTGTKVTSKPTAKPTTKPTTSPYKPGYCSVCGGDGEVVSTCVNCNVGWTRCLTCGGSGSRDCIICGGLGRERCFVCGGSGIRYNGKPCFSCSGGSVPCSFCGGRGRKDCGLCGGSGKEKCPICIGGLIYQRCNVCN
ncbi:MAG: hypothetical protein IJ343_15960 [Clostridia bacterium]|nr:hypothetical protein [Clostridia bacterium]